MTEKGVARLADAWRKAQEAWDRRELSEREWRYLHAASKLAQEHPDEAWDFVTSVIRVKPSTIVYEILGAGPLEDLLNNHGEWALPKVEEALRIDPDFKRLLEYVWLRADANGAAKRLIELGCDEVST